MQRNMLHPHKILPTRQTLRQRKLHLTLPTTRPAHLAARKRRALAIHLEPDITRAVERRCRLACGHFREVELQGAGMRDTGGGGEADGVAGAHRVGGGRGAGGELVAADGGGGDVCYGAWGWVLV